jgi:hypothetical protein
MALSIYSRPYLFHLNIRTTHNFELFFSPVTMKYHFFFLLLVLRVKTRAIALIYRRAKDD